MLFKPQLFTFHKDGKRQNLTASTLAGQSICLMPRGQCSFRRIKLSGNRKKALQAAAFRVRQESDSSENKFTIIADANGKKASVWGFRTHDNHAGRYIPESISFKPMSAGARIVKLTEGYEGQVWEQGSLIASRWWIKPPSPKGWVSFLHSFENPQESNYQKIPDIQELPYRTNFPIFEMDQARAAQLFSPANLGGIVALGLICGALFISGQFLRNEMTLRTVEGDIEALSTVTSQISAERRQALANIRQSQKYTAIGHSGTVLLGLADASLVLDKKGLLIEKMTMRSGAFEIQMRSSGEIDIPALVMALEAQPSLANVSMALGFREVVTITADLVSPYDYPQSPTGESG